MGQEHSKAVPRTFEVGDLVEFHRGTYSHWGVYIGDEDVVHLTPDVKRKLVASSESNDLTNSENGIHSGWVKQEKLLDVALNSKVEKNNNKDSINSPLPREEIKKRALESLGPRSYNMLTNNCEHFASWCRNDIEQSQQVDNAKNVGDVALRVLPLVGVGGLVYKTNTDGNGSNMKTCNGVGPELLTDFGGLPYAPFTGGIDMRGEIKERAVWGSRPTSNQISGGVDLGVLARVGGTLYDVFTGEHYRRSFPGGALSSIVPTSYSDYTQNMDYLSFLQRNGMIQAGGSFLNMGIQTGTCVCDIMNFQKR